MIINYEDLHKVRNKNKKKKIVLCAGCYDLFHIGHLNFINNAKSCGDTLVVAVLSDEFTKSAKNPNRPIIKENDRSTIIDNLKSVDYTIILNQSKQDENLKSHNLSPRELKLIERYISIIDELHPDIFFISKDTKISDATKQVLNDRNIEVILADYTSEISTTSIINMIESSK